MASACVIVRQCMLRRFIKSLLQNICESGSVVLCKIRMVQLSHAIYLGNFECFIVVGAKFFHTAVNQWSLTSRKLERKEGEKRKDKHNHNDH